MSQSVRRATIVIGVVVMVIGLAWTVREAVRPESTVVGGDREGWSLRVPDGWTVSQRSTRDDGGPCSYAGYEDGVVVSSEPYPFLDPDGRPSCVGRYIMERFPRSGVAVALMPFARSGLFTDLADTEYPLSWHDLEHSDAIRAGPAKVSLGMIVIEGMPVYDVRVWLGRDASERDRAALDEVLASIRFLRGPP